MTDGDHGGDHGSTVRGWLRGLEVFRGPLPDFEPERAPDHPQSLFPARLSDVVADDLGDPHAMVEVEFWQAAKSRTHTRLRYERAGDAWHRYRLWP